MESLKHSYDSIRRELGRMLGTGRDYTGWGTDVTQDAEDIIKSGLRSFYWPVGPDGQTHVWSFLRQLGTLELVTGIRGNDLPVDFGGFISGLNFDSGSGEVRVEQVPEEDVRAMYSAADASGAPKYFSLRVKRSPPPEESQYEVLVYPVPDKSYTTTFRYAMIPSMLSADNLYPLGGAQHAETILEAILTAAEKTLNDTQDVHAKRFQACLAASMALDVKQFGI